MKNVTRLPASKAAHQIGHRPWRRRGSPPDALLGAGWAGGRGPAHGADTHRQLGHARPMRGSWRPRSGTAAQPRALQGCWPDQRRPSAVTTGEFAGSGIIWPGDHISGRNSRMASILRPPLTMSCAARDV